MKHVSAKGVNSLDFIGQKASGTDFAEVEELLKINYGIDYEKAKTEILFQLIVEEGWTSHRLRTTAKWFVKNKKYPAWKIADWFEYSNMLYPYHWYQEQLQKYGTRINAEIECYEIEGKMLYRYADGDILPFDYKGLLSQFGKTDQKKS